MRKLSIRKNEPDDKTRQKEAAIMTKPKNVLEAFECIVELAQNSGLDKEFYEKTATHIRFASRKLRLTATQTVLLAQFVDRSESTRIYLSEIAEYTGCRTTRFLRLTDEIDVLEQKHYLRASRSNDSLSYRVPPEVLQALRRNQPYEHREEPVPDTQTFFDRFNVLMKEKDDNELRYCDLMTSTGELLEKIQHTAFARCLRSYNMQEENRLLFIFMAFLFVENNDDNIRFHDIDDLYDDGNVPSWCKWQLRNHSSELFELQLIENVNEDGMARSDAFKLTDKAKGEVLGELNLDNVGRSDKGLIKAGSLAEKQLIYNDEEAAQIEDLSSILTQDRFADVQTRLEKAGMRKGFCCLFYGAPGTGKTETVYQLARLTGRDIMRVDVDKIKSCWVGESEKNIKALFDRYRNICRDSDLAPILLFNEADAVLGIRMEGASRAVDKMENSIQNIILQEMESLDGIMIATTNLTTNLDTAFERRFLYKIRYDRPTEEARAKIWRIMLPELSENDARTLAAQFDFSGGEIENIVRKHSVAAILSGKDIIDLPALTDACAHERIATSTAPSIGFR